MANVYELANLMSRFTKGEVDLTEVKTKLDEYGLDVEVKPLSDYLPEGITMNPDLIGVNGTCELDTGTGFRDKIVVVNDTTPNYNTGVMYSVVMAGKFRYRMEGNRLAEFIGTEKEK